MLPDWLNRRLRSVGRQLEDVSAWLSSQPWDEVALPQPVQDIPTMISLQERSLLYLLARDHWSETGAIIDAGCFLGGSTIALAEGLLARSTGSTQTPIHTYDLFRADAVSLASHGFMLPGRRIGDSIRDMFDLNLGERLSLVNVHEGDVLNQHWAAGPIEVLFLDICKSWEINDHVTHEFFPHLLPGRSVVVQQDYVHEFAPWLHITMELLADAFIYVGSLPFASAVFIPRRRIRSREIPRRLLTDVDDQRKLALMRRSAERYEGEDRGVVESAYAYLLYELGRSNEALAHLDEVESVYRGDRLRIVLESTRARCSSAPVGAASRSS